jgi:hypothetical protein
MSPTLNLTSEEYDCVFVARGFVKRVGAEKPAKKVKKGTTPLIPGGETIFCHFPFNRYDISFHSIKTDGDKCYNKKYVAAAGYIWQRTRNDSSSFLLWKWK